MESTPLVPTDRPALDPLLPPPPNDMEIAAFGLKLQVEPKSEQPELPALTKLVQDESRPVSWGERVKRFERELAAAQPLRDARFAERNLLILQLWADRQPGDASALAKICRYAKTKAPVVFWVLSRAKRGEHSRLINRARAGRRGKRAQILAALKNGADPKAVAAQFGIHRTTLLRATRQLNKTGGNRR